MFDSEEESPLEQGYQELARVEVLGLVVALLPCLSTRVFVFRDRN